MSRSRPRSGRSRVGGAAALVIAWLSGQAAAAPVASAPAAAAGVEAMSVEEAVDEALRHNLQLLAQTYEVPLARAETVTARLRLNPTFSVGADHLDLLGTHYDDVNHAGPEEFFVRTDWLFRTGRKRKRRIEVAEESVVVAEQQLRDAVRRLVRDVQCACVDVQSAAAAVELAVINRDLFARVVALNEVRVDNGDLAKVDLTRAQIAELQARNELRQAQGAQRIATNHLALLLGRTQVAAAISVTGEMRADAAPRSLGEIQALALRRRPDLRAAHSEQRFTQLDIRRQIAEGKVDLSVGVEARRQQGLAGTGNSLGFFVVIPLRLFDRNQGQIERSRQQAAQADQRALAVEQAIRIEAENAHVAYEVARDLLASFEGGMLVRAEQVLATAEYAYRRGEASLIELIDAQRAHNDTRRTYNEARADFARALYEIDAVTALGSPP
ncbi:TolC family protein [Nannocystis punicea]|uniref:TolC family protein n=1 Tax=Nannocystis punicea TaxID=2995304 RepID=A0ABY7GT35_9BACT|nr:TolC family protein [Nannocystis poenicansa]WAS90095.1 TolC family protein [Nannocystis poenicansa]